MKKNLNTADLLVKMTLATLTILFYFIDLINGPFAQVLMVLSIIVIIIYLTKLLNPSD